MTGRWLPPFLVAVAIAAAVAIGGVGEPTAPPGDPSPAGAPPAPARETKPAGPRARPERLPPPATRPPRERPAEPAVAGRYEPASAAPGAAIPGGSLAAHEGIEGAHTLERHVGVPAAALRERAEREGKREVSSFPDLEAADRAVGEVLFRSRERIRRWLAERPSGLWDLEVRLERPVGTVWRREAARAVEGRTVVVVIAPSTRFPEGFRVHTAYVATP